MKTFLRKSTISRDNEGIIVGSTFSGISPKTIDILTLNYVNNEFIKVNNMINGLISMILENLMENKGYNIGEFSFKETLFFCKEKNLLTDPFILKSLLENSLKTPQNQLETQKSIRILYSLLYFIDSQDYSLNYGPCLKSLQELLLKL